MNSQKKISRSLPNRTLSNGCPKGIYHIDPTVIPLSFVIEFIGQINRVFIRHQFGLLLETLSLVVENIVHQIGTEQIIFSFFTPLVNKQCKARNTITNTLV